jgi:WD40 repeat protein
MTKTELPGQRAFEESLIIQISGFLRHSSFVIRHSTPVLLGLSIICCANTISLSAADFSAVDSIFAAHCLDCHASQEPEAQLVLETFETLMKGGEIGPAILPGKSSESLLVQMIEGRFEKDGKKKIMPPGKRTKLTSQEIATIKTWIDAGAAGPAFTATPKELVVPKILPKTRPRNPVNALAFSTRAKLLAVARYGEIELRRPDLSLARALPGHRGNVNGLVFSENGAQVFAVGGQPGVSGEIRQWNVQDGKLVRVLEGHKDALYAVALSPDGETLASGGYDQKVKLWNLKTGTEIRTLSGHNGCVYRLSFRPDGKILASASADRTVKLWDVASGERRETLSQSFKELYAVAFSPDGARLVAGGADNRIRIWQISPTAAETTNPMLDSLFAHEGVILNLVFSADGKTLLSSADDRTVKIWNADQMTERTLLEKQPDWPPALAFVDNGSVAVGRLDGSVAIYDVSGKVIASLGPNSEPASAEMENAKVKLAGATLPRVSKSASVAK